MSILFVVSTPIGNLEDITFRAVRILSEADIIASEDTRHTKILLDRYSIKTLLSSYHKFNVKSKTNYFIDLLREGKKVALVSDAGTPGISDPGYELIEAAIKNNIQIVPIPGASAFTVALSVSGLSTDRFLFLGFLPRKPGKIRKILKMFTIFDGTIIIYESPYRLLKTLKFVQEVFGERNVVIARELTKKFEEILRGTVSSVYEKFVGRNIKGEIVLLIDGSKQAAQSGEM
ncbi:16S rRNA (cytidine(1402)-2'-O)-methyltransferase [candidate division WOR-1 bacterium RIFOXYD2_FULL_36_8]|uniref:Ribosomal RNA small subunit methyltransferase I n=1 Tax=candidate division WOR-1 bacterium RIFOXYB2_FULL_36_35 TaxID=1802578 RepID=A0A1F4S8T2_UNCSA|nr:MAG: 16S rRNA (cytidine(1402)-2'-O)-methyltransferase [candidate division WOR-1 bacterium RIFOXYA2_FULL_36_21]OGC16797.1 MAG: 16S rRNA (cytidine(1402)-2'-O)-methyltransferase [candidate division WOR-1 bacterium RIFOXYB2_FULL_36_35]OGC19812.1 MAG: 16S rRNA (cytidine(1402)-2'-O)-methyltransferase [candidate division WOR-1 bacterium RIFOXYA12_FULL_36_13]OGC37303.1 MAG: 16S rRNA (cytidine(1402)-2'-O)-methyltransferase [candidate division WOR-1 bacterium RIFOXYD2_FULL_36_8]